MISSKNYESVKIQIVTYKSKNEDKMEDGYKRNKNNSRFICSICLSTKPLEEKHNEENNLQKRKHSCPICYKTCDFFDNGHTGGKKQMEFDTKLNQTSNNTSSKNVQTSQNNLNDGLSLLNEVLNVFQTKKFDLPNEITSKTVLRKDASVSTDSLVKTATKPNLSMSKVYKFSITEMERIREHPKFVVLNACQPDRPSPKLTLSKHKSSSIPQMKLEELKYSLKEKTRSKDAIEEVNRMFATVSKYDKENGDDSNRPMIRNGPRVLPVVKTENYEDLAKNYTSCELESRNNSCKCCQTSFCSPGGDSKGCCVEEKELDVARCDKCVYMLSCHAKHKIRTGIMICACCKSGCKRREKECCNLDA